MHDAIHLFPLAFGLGLLHALDADHVLAISAATSNTNRQNTIKFCLHWALGHGLTMLLVGVAVIAFGSTIPVKLSQWAEAGVGLLLLVLSLWLFLQLRPSRKATSSETTKTGTRSAPFVGVLHGLAGSAPFLLLLPLGILSMTQGLIYILLFCLGVLLAMMLFGSLLNGLWNRLSSHTSGRDRKMVFRLGIALLCMTMGANMLLTNLIGIQI